MFCRCTSRQIYIFSITPKILFCESLFVYSDVFSVSLSVQYECRQVETVQSASVDSIPEVLEDKESVTEQSDSASLSDMDYVNPRGVRFTQSTQRDGKYSYGVVYMTIVCVLL